MPLPTSAIDALQFLQALHLAQVRADTPDLSQRQMSVLLTVYLEPPPHTVRGLAATLGVTKPVITRALNAMAKHKLIDRRRDPNDKRNVLVGRTVQGTLFLDRLGDLVVSIAKSK